MPPLYIPDNLVRLVEEPTGIVAVSLSDCLVARLGRPTIAECSANPGEPLSPGVPFATVETNKTVFEVSLPFPAVFQERNDRVAMNVSLLETGGPAEGWLCKVRPTTGSWREGLLDEVGFATFIAP